MRVLIVGDGLALTTGFAQVIRRCAVAFVARGWDVHQIPCLDEPPYFRSTPYEALGVTAWPVKNDVGYGTFGDVLDATDPDVLFFNGDPATIRNWYLYLESLHRMGPSVVYAPIEGAPIIEANAEPFRWATRALTYTAWSAERLHEEHSLDIPWVWHGVDRDQFHPLTEGQRREYRRLLGWEGKFVVGYVARNAWRKSHDRLITAIRLLRDGNGATIAPADDYKLYLHCRAWDNNALGGWDLNFLRHLHGLTDQVQFADHGTATRGEEALRLTQKLGCLDLYVHPAKVEGFGLPILEAMATGLPVVVPADGGNMEEVVGDAALARVPPLDWDTWFNGARLANVSPADLAYVIDRAKHDRRLREAAGARSLERAQLFSWDSMAERICRAIEEAVSGDTTDEVAVPTFAEAI